MHLISSATFLEDTKKSWENNGNRTCHSSPSIYFGPVLANSLAAFQLMRITIQTFPQRFLSFNHEAWSYTVAFCFPILACLAQLFTYLYTGTLCIDGSIEYSLKKLGIEVNWNEIHTTEIEIGNYIFILVSFMEVFIQLYPRIKKLKSWLAKKKNRIYPEQKPDGLGMMEHSNVLAPSTGYSVSNAYPQVAESIPGPSRMLDTTELILVVHEPNTHMAHKTDITRKDSSTSHDSNASSRTYNHNETNNDDTLDYSSARSTASVGATTRQRKAFNLKDLNSFLIFIAITPLLIIYHFIYDLDNIKMYIGSVFMDIIYFVIPTYWVWNSQKVLDFVRLKHYQLVIHLGFY